MSEAISGIDLAARSRELTTTLGVADYILESAVTARLDEVSIEYRRGDAGKGAIPRFPRRQLANTSRRTAYRKGDT
jgi:hypothetical protein